MVTYQKVIERNVADLATILFSHTGFIDGWSYGYFERRTFLGFNISEMTGEIKNEVRREISGRSFR